jgi:hypothetical protein
MISRFPAPWRIVELPTGFAVEDTTGLQLGVFYGRAPCSAGHTGIMTIDEARQVALDFARLPELLQWNSEQPREGARRHRLNPKHARLIDAAYQAQHPRRSSPLDELDREAGTSCQVDHGASDF